MIFESRNIVSKNVKDTKKLLVNILRIAFTKKYPQMKITPLDDRIIAKTGIFIEGYMHDIEDLLDELKKLKLNFVDIPYELRRKSYEPKVERNDK